MSKNILAAFLLLFLLASLAKAQDSIVSYNKATEYELAGIKVSGIQFLDNNALILLSGLRVGERLDVPGEKIEKAIDKLWKHGLFSDIKIFAEKTEGDKIYLEIALRERPRLSELIFFEYKPDKKTGKLKPEALSATDQEDLNELVKLKRGYQVTENTINNIRYQISKHYKEDGYHNVDIKVAQRNDTSLINAVIVEVYIDKKEKVKISEIDIVGNTLFTDNKIERAMKDTKEKSMRNFFRSSKYNSESYKDDKKKIIEKYNQDGYRNATIVYDSVITNADNTLTIRIRIDEGRQFYFRNIAWVGNSKFTSDQLTKALGIKKGDIYDEEKLNKRLIMDEDAVGNLYLDDGYLFYSCNPVEILNDNDSIDLEMRIYEGRQATINRVLITGNTRTNDHVIRREVRSQPGDLFRKSDITRTIRELAQLGHFDPEKLNVNPTPNPNDGTVDLEYIVEERANDQVEISGGWGANMVIGTIGLRFNNFSARNIFNASAWRPVPQGDGQQLSLRVQSNGTRYQSYSLTFVEPWLGGKKRNSFSFSLYHTIQTNGYKAGDDRRAHMKISGASIGFGRQLQWPDDYFSLYHEIAFQKYDVQKWYYFTTSGNFNSISLNTVFARNSVDNPMYTRRGSNLSLGLQITPPYSYFNNKNYSDTSLSDSQRFKWIEYHKWSIKADWYTKIFPSNDLVFCARYHLGFLGYFNKNAQSPFEKYQVGGDGMSGYNLYGTETIALRGYENYAFSPNEGSNLYNKFTMELRYLLSPNPQAMIYVLAFAEAGNAWNSFKDYNPYKLNRSAGVGARIFLPMLGMLGIDWGYGFDPIPGQSKEAWGSHFHFVIGQQF